MYCFVILVHELGGNTNIAYFSLTVIRHETIFHVIVYSKGVLFTDYIAHNCIIEAIGLVHIYIQTDIFSSENHFKAYAIPILEIN